MAYRAKGPAQPKPLVRLDVDLGPEVSLGSTRGANVIISPDGTRLVYAFGGGPLDEVRSNRKLVTRKLDQPTATELDGTEGAFAPFFSPDGQWIAFFAGGKLKKVSVEGGAPAVLCDAPNPAGGSWGEDGNVTAALSSSDVLWRIPSTGGPPTPATVLTSQELAHRWPQMLAGGTVILFTSETPTGPNIDLVSLKDRRRKTLVRGGTFGRFFG